MPDKNDTAQDEIRIDVFLRWIWRGKWLILLLIVVASAIAAVMGMQQRETHTATGLIEVGRVWGRPIRDIYVTVETANNPAFVQEVAEKAGLRAGQLSRHVQVNAVEAGRPRSMAPILVRVTATNESSEEAVHLAQLIADEIVARHQKLFDEALAPHIEQQHWLEQKLSQAGTDQDIALKLRTQLDEVVSNNSSPIMTDRTHLVERIVAGPAQRPGNLRGVVTAAVIAGVAGIIIACLIGYFRPE